MQHRTIFRDVDLLAVKHRFDPGAQSGLLGERDQQSEGLVIDAVFGIVQKDAGSFRRHPFRARGIVSEECPQVAVPHSPLVIFELPPHCLLVSPLRPRHLQMCSHLCTSAAQPGGFERHSARGRGACFPHSRNPPRKAFALSPARECAGSASSFLTLPPPITMSSGSSAAKKRATTSATSRRHFFLPRRSSPALPT